MSVRVAQDILMRRIFSALSPPRTLSAGEAKDAATRQKDYIAFCMRLIAERIPTDANAETAELIAMRASDELLLHAQNWAWPRPNEIADAVQEARNKVLARQGAATLRIEKPQDDTDVVWFGPGFWPWYYRTRADLVAGEMVREDGEVISLHAKVRDESIALLDGFASRRRALEAGRLGKVGGGIHPPSLAGGPEHHEPRREAA